LLSILVSHHCREEFPTLDVAPTRKKSKENISAPEPTKKVDDVTSGSSKKKSSETVAPIVAEKPTAQPQHAPPPPQQQQQQQASSKKKSKLKKVDPNLLGFSNSPRPMNTGADDD
jgi:hypothetical protein